MGLKERAIYLFDGLVLFLTPIICYGILHNWTFGYIWIGLGVLVGMAGIASALLGLLLIFGSIAAE